MCWAAMNKRPWVKPRFFQSEGQLRTTRFLDRDPLWMGKRLCGRRTGYAQKAKVAGSLDA